ncbi:thyroid receptor-interacting protein 11 isoform X2 [Anoplophora glabripennis]|nr:thyroid receptor-interacting protein 11 isoform X2 [Anoplophora glabripennis]
MGQLEQLDLENQQNLAKVVGMKDKLQEENNDLQDEIDRLKQEHRSRDEKLKLELNELQARFEKTQRTNNADDGYNEKYESLLQVNQKLKMEEEELKKELSVLKSSNATLQKTIEDFKADKEDNINTMQQLEIENKQMHAELQKSKEDAKRFEKKSSEDTETCERLASILEAYEKQVVALKEELQNERARNEKVQLSLPNEEVAEKLRKDLKSSHEDHQKELNLLKAEIDHAKNMNKDLQLANDTLSENNLQQTKDLENFSKNHETQMNALLEEVNALKDENSKLQSYIKTENGDLVKAKRELDDIQKSQERLLLELHNKYVNIITENIKKFQDCDKPSDFQHCYYEDSPQIAEFSKQVENILKILLDFKCKCEMLEKQVYDLSEEKTKILTEKNHEIEKLIQNSEILSQEVITKTETIKDYENECNELAKNNELLINELGNYKNNSGLQTISESNEDNMVLLESQLENANKRIEDLEKIIDDFENQQKQIADIETDQIDTALQQLNITETEITKKEKDYHELLSSFDQLQIEYESLKSDFDNARENLVLAVEENQNLKSNVEKIKVDYENTEYQLSEVNVSIDGLNEEIEAYKKKLDLLAKENDQIRTLYEESCKNCEDIKTELFIFKEKLLEEEDSRKRFEIQVRTLTEKLQNAKMAETSLKLQYDTVSKEVMALSETKHNLEVSLKKVNTELGQFETSYVELQRQNNKLIEEHEILKIHNAKREEQIKNFEALVEDLQTKLEKYEKLAIDENGDLLKKLSLEDNFRVMEGLKKYENLAMEENQQIFKNMSMTDKETSTNNMDVDVRESSSKEFEELKQREASLHQQLQEITNSRNELINIVTTKHQESVAYHNEIQRISQFLNMETQKCKNLELELNQLKSSPRPDEVDAKNQEIEKLIDQNNFLKEKCEIMAKNLLEEQSKVQQLLGEKSNPSEKEITLQKKVDRLQTHLIELEEHYTQELLQAEQKNAELQEKVNEIEEREKSSSTMYTSVSIRANQQVESLQSQLQAVMNERDSLRNKISDAEDLNNKHVAALTNLQFVLEQFQKDKEKDVMKETERIRRQINAEKKVQDDLKREIASLKSQLEESKQGLQAASRLSDQLDNSKKLVSALKEEASQLQEKLSKSEENLKKATSQTDGKIEKSLIKSLIIGLVSSNNNLNKDQRQILKIIATVLDFNQQDHDKVSLNASRQESWLGSLLAPQSSSQETLSRAFIEFLENESKPRVVPSLLNASETEKSEPNGKPSTPRQSPIVLSEIVLPTFDDFPQSRNSSSILKDVLKNNNS